MRFLLYREVGGFLPPHTDLAKANRSGQLSTCTFIIYLSDCEVGGETCLLETLEDASQPLAVVKPKRGRLLIFPHMCPHEAKAVVADGLPKALLRGEIL